MTFAVDTGAFYTGRKLGKHKLYPAVSPKKSWEGLIGGSLSALILGGVSAIWLPVGFFKILGLSLALAIVSQIGDFFESALKRQAGVKDSGGLLPGHGGILDRIDGVLFALPLSYYCWQWWLK
ncbi:Phosphatidate cytidylyltransferase [Candidatus Methanoperedenaceae archaeon GB37]|nr:Phosphatidate cytidylyltransferase [Candidatus Methanoperedenaceae archaeon GB37]